MTAGKRISRRTFWAQLQVSSFIRWEDIEGRSKKRHGNRIEIMPITLLNTSTRCASLCSTVWRLSSMQMGGWLCIDMSLSYVLKTWTLCTFLSQYIDDNNGWKLFFNSRGTYCYHGQWGPNSSVDDPTRQITTTTTSGIMAMLSLLKMNKSSAVWTTSLNESRVTVITMHLIKNSHICIHRIPSGE